MAQRQQLPERCRVNDSDVFDLRLSWNGYRVNKMCNALSDSASRLLFKQSEEAFMEEYGLTAEERELVRRRDFQGLLDRGANIYFLLKLGVVTGHGLYQMGARMRGQTHEQFMATRNQPGAT
jgi:protocatechuate 4,5-dioxygenase, alpha chain